MDVEEKLQKIKKETLFNYYKMLRYDDGTTLKTINRENGLKGEAAFCRSKEDGKIKIRIFEGNPDGSDDKTLSIGEFVVKYNFYIDYCYAA